MRGTNPVILRVLQLLDRHVGVFVVIMMSYSVCLHVCIFVFADIFHLKKFIVLSKRGNTEY